MQRIINIVDFDTVSDTTLLSTQAVQKVIDRYSQNQGGKVIIPTGSYKMGTLILKSNARLYLEQSATDLNQADVEQNSEY